MVDRGAGSVEWMWIMRVSCWFGGRGFMGCVGARHTAARFFKIFHTIRPTPATRRHTRASITVFRKVNPHTRTHAHIHTYLRRAGGEREARHTCQGTNFSNFSKSFHTPGDQTCNLHGCDGSEFGN